MRSAVSTMITGDGQVVREREDAGGVDVVGRPVPLDAAKHAGAGQAGFVGAMDDLGGQRGVAVMIGFADEDGEALLVPFELHLLPPSVAAVGRLGSPDAGHTAGNPATRLAAA